MGAEIVLQVVRDLVPLGLENASSLLLAGSSAGGTGVMLNLDHVHSLVHHNLGKLHFQPPTFTPAETGTFSLMKIPSRYARRLETHRDQRRVRFGMVPRQGSILAERFVTG